MAFTKLIGQSIEYRDIKKMPHIPQEGTFLYTKDVPSKFADSGFQKLHVIKTKEKLIGIYGFTMLDASMKMIDPNTLVRITYQGKEDRKTRFGMRACHVVDVEIDDGVQALNFEVEEDD